MEPVKVGCVKIKKLFRISNKKKSIFLENYFIKGDMCKKLHANKHFSCVIFYTRQPSRNLMRKTLEGLKSSRIL